MLLNPKRGVREYPDEASREMMLAVIDFFESKGLARIKHDDHERVWYQDFLGFVKEQGLFFACLTPPEYGEEGSRWDTWRNCELNEILGFYGLAYWYTWQVTILGLGPIWMSGNEEVKRKTARFLEEGGIFAFGLSEKEHGADLYSSETTLYPQEGGTFLARGEKYYIGNGNEAALVSVFGKVAESDDYVFFVVDPRHERYECVKNVCNSQNYVAHFALLGEIRFHDYRPVYGRVSLSNVHIFKKQIRTFRHLLIAARPNREQIQDIDFLLILGELFTLVVYGQLILENASVHSVDDDVLDQIFNFLVRDFSKFALQLYSKTSSTSMQRFFCRRMIRKPVVDHARFERVWEEHVVALRGAYRMSE